MNTTSKASNAFEAFFGIHELPPPPSPSTSPLPLPLPPPRVLSTTLKARKLHWRNPMANIGIDIIGIRISQQRHGEHNTDGNTRVTSRSHGSVLPSSRDSRPSVLPLLRNRGIHSPRCRSTHRVRPSDTREPLLFTLHRVSLPPVCRLFAVGFVHDDDDVKTAR